MRAGQLEAQALREIADEREAAKRNAAAAHAKSHADKLDDTA